MMTQSIDPVFQRRVDALATIGRKELRIEALNSKWVSDGVQRNALTDQDSDIRSAARAGIRKKMLSTPLEGLLLRLETEKELEKGSDDRVDVLVCAKQKVESENRAVIGAGVGIAGLMIGGTALLMAAGEKLFHLPGALKGLGHALNSINPGTLAAVLVATGSVLALAFVGLSARTSRHLQRFEEQWIREDEARNYVSRSSSEGDED